jgi:signal peptidase I
MLDPARLSMITGPGWAGPYISKLKTGKIVPVTVFSTSMNPYLQQGDVVMLQPASKDTILVGDFVLCRVSGRDYLHRVVSKNGDKFLIADGTGTKKGSAVYGQIFGRVFRVLKGKAAKKFN